MQSECTCILYGQKLLVGPLKRARLCSFVLYLSAVVFGPEFAYYPALYYTLLYIQPFVHMLLFALDNRCASENVRVPVLPNPKNEQSA